MTGLDTNVLVRYFTRDDPRQFRVAERLFEEIAERGGFVNVVVLCELAWVLEGAYGLERRAIVDVFRRLMDTAQLSIEDREMVARAVDEFAEGKAGFADYLIGVRNRAAGCDATATFDRALRGSDGFRVL
jgi:predicted nucleic-acid-binding protein